MAGERKAIQTALNRGEGILRLLPTWVPRSFCVPGKRLKLDPADHYAFGADRGGIDERWLASTAKADNGPGTRPDEGLSYVQTDGAAPVLLRDAVELCGGELLGADVMRSHGGWTMFAKFFDNQLPLPFHVHHSDARAAEVGQKGKPEAYYFPRQLNPHAGAFPLTFFGLDPGTTRDDVKRCLARWEQGDNGILDLSRAWRIRPGTGWDVPPGVLHAPGTLLTYEPQRASDVYAMFQSLVWDSYLPVDRLWHDVPPAKRGDLEAAIALLDWEANVDPLFHEHRFMPPKPVRPLEEMRADGVEERWIAYKSEWFSAKELTVLPGRTAVVRDEGAYGAIVIQGRGRIGPLEVESPAAIRFGEATRDEIFVTADAARRGVELANTSQSESLVLLEHFGPHAARASS
jgi:hypothetical protein